MTHFVYPPPENFDSFLTTVIPRTRRKSTDSCHSNGRRNSRKGSIVLMPNQYICETEYDDLGPDDSVIDFAFISEEKFVLVFLLASNGEIVSFYQVGSESLHKRVTKLRSLIQGAVEPCAICVSPDASFAVVACRDSDIIVIPTKRLLDVSWGAEQSTLLCHAPFEITFAGNTGGMDPKLVPTSIKCVVSLAQGRHVVIMATKGGSIFIVDLEARKCLVEMCAPQSIHNVEIIKNRDRIDLLLTSFISSQWVIPFENNGRAYPEVLSACIPAELRQVGPCTTSLSVCGEEISALNSEANAMEIYTSLDMVGTIPKKKYKIPPETWMIHSTNNVIFTVSRKPGAFFVDSEVGEMRCAIHFGLSHLRLEYTVLRGAPEWRLLSFVPLATASGHLPSCFIITERGLVRLRQDPQCHIEDVLAEFLFRLPEFSLDSLNSVCDAAGVEVSKLKNTLIPRILATKKQKKFSAELLSRILFMAKVIELKIEALVDLFSSNEQEHNLLNEVLRLVEADKRSPLKARVVELFAKKCVNGRGRDDFSSYRQKKDGELSAFLSRHPEVSTGVESVLVIPMWKSAHLLGSRSAEATSTVLLYVINHGKEQFSKADGTLRSQMLACVSQLDWSCLSPKQADDLANVLCGWILAHPSIAHAENCLRLANKYAEKFPDSCSLLYCVAAMYLMSEDGKRETKTTAEAHTLSSGLNCSTAISFDDRLVVWGSLTNEQPKSLEQSVVPIKVVRKTSSLPSSPLESPRKRPLAMPHSIHIGSRPQVVSCGTEHVLVLTVAGELYSWGNNRFGQCGVGNNVPVIEPQLVEGKWAPIKQLAAGQFHSAILCEDGSLWTWGWGVYGQLGHGGRSIRDCHQPKKVPELGCSVKSVSCGRVHTVVLTTDGNILIAGSGSYGQSGSDEDIKKLYSFTPLRIEQGLKFVKATTRFYHSLAVTSDGRLFEWGRNPQEMKMKMFVMRRLRNAQKGIKEADDSPSKLPMDIPRDDLGCREVSHLLDGAVEDLSTGLSHSAVITDKGSLFTWGKALEYQLGHGNKSERCEPHQVFEPVGVRWKHVECGGNHTVAATEDGRVFSWGRNDFTQCGMPSEKTTSSPRKYFYQGKEGVKRCVQLPEDSVFVAKPSLVPDVQLRVPQTGDPVRALNEETLMNHLNTADIKVLQTVSRHFLSSSLSPSLSSSVPLALCHLMSGNVSAALDQTGRALSAHGQSREVIAMASLAWEVIANHEDAQTKELLAKAFRELPLTQTQRNSSQLRNLWPNVWDSPICQRDLSPKEKMAVLESWAVAVKPVTSCELPGGSLRTGAARVRVWAQCGHVEPASLGVAKECSTCTDEWRDKLRLTLGSD